MPISRDRATVSVRVRPHAPRNELIGFSNGVWQVRLTALPVAGKANQALISFLSGLLHIAPSRVSIVRGHRSRHKLLAIAGLSQEEITGWLAAGDRVRTDVSSTDATG